MNSIQKEVEMFGLLCYWIVERHAIYERRFEDMPKPWTMDPILQTYSFCNVYRELDRVSQWIGKEWRHLYGTILGDEEVWFAMVVARLINWPDTLQELGYPVPWNQKRFRDTLHDRRARDEKAFGGAYIVSTNGHAMDKADYLAERVLGPLWENRIALRPRRGDTLRAFHARLMQFDGMGSFMAAQVVADMKYVPPLTAADDWWSFAASGPGSRRGMNRLLGRDLRAPWKEAEWHRALTTLLKQVGPVIAAHKMAPLHAQDLQNCLCEFDKYVRTKNGEGRPRSTYPGLT